MIELTSKDLRRAQEMLKQIPNGVLKAAAPAINRAVEGARTAATRQLSMDYFVKRSTGLRTMVIKRASAKSLSAELHSSGNLIPLSAFKVKTGPPVTAKIKRTSGASGAGRGAFTATMKEVGFGQFRRAAEPGQAHEGVFGRIKGVFMKGKGPRAKKRGAGMTKGREAIYERYGPSVPQMLDRDEVREAVQARTQEVFETRFLHEVDRVLDKGAGK